MKRVETHSMTGENASAGDSSTTEREKHTMIEGADTQSHVTPEVTVDIPGQGLWCTT